MTATLLEGTAKSVKRSRHGSRASGCREESADFGGRLEAPQAESDGQSAAVRTGAKRRAALVGGEARSATSRRAAAGIGLPKSRARRCILLSSFISEGTFTNFRL
jgi:hypothetical protein